MQNNARVTVATMMLDPAAVVQFQQQKSQELPVLLALQKCSTLCTGLSVLAGEMCVCLHIWANRLQCV